MSDPRTIIRRPIISEKGTRVRGTTNCYLFEIDPRANKIEVGKAIEEIFDVHVVKVRTISCKGKPKRLGRHSGYRNDWKKAIVTLKADESIEVFDQV